MPKTHDILPSTLSALDETLTFMRALWHLEHALERASKHMEDSLGVTGPQRLALRVVGVVPGIGPAELAAALHLHPSTITGVLQRLESRGLVERVGHESDGRRVMLRVTRAGKRMNVPSSPGTVERAVRTALRRVPARQRAATLSVIATLVEELTPTDRPGAKTKQRKRPAR
jgi:DNA-binding MarR family transcriptional regulator